MGDVTVLASSVGAFERFLALRDQLVTCGRVSRSLR